MVNKFVVYDCKSGYITTKDKIPSFNFLFKDQDFWKDRNNLLIALTKNQIKFYNYLTL